MKKLLPQNHIALEGLLRCVGLIIPMVWMTKEWAWFIFLTLFLLVEILQVRVYLKRWTNLN